MFRGRLDSKTPRSLALFGGDDFASGGSVYLHVLSGRSEALRVLTAVQVRHHPCHQLGGLQSEELHRLTRCTYFAVLAAMLPFRTPWDSAKQIIQIPVKLVPLFRI